jgi:hypothetical protein
MELNGQQLMQNITSMKMYYILNAVITNISHMPKIIFFSYNAATVLWETE